MTPPLPPNLLVIAASNGENLKLAERFAAQARVQGLSAEVLDLTAVELPLFTPRACSAGTPPAVASLHQKLVAATHWVICAPEYNGSIPPVLTSAFAWLSVLGDDFRALFNGRPIAMASHSGSGGYEVLTALRIQLAHLGAQVVGRQLIANNNKPAHASSIEAILQALMHLRAAE